MEFTLSKEGKRNGKGFGKEENNTEKGSWFLKMGHSAKGSGKKEKGKGEIRERGFGVNLINAFIRNHSGRSLGKAKQVK